MTSRHCLELWLELCRPVGSAMTADGAEPLLSEAWRLGARRVRLELRGGCCPDLETIARAASAIGYSVEVSDPGGPPSEPIGLLRRLDAGSLVVRLDSAIAVEHDGLHGEGSHAHGVALLLLAKGRGITARVESAPAFDADEAFEALLRLAARAGAEELVVLGPGACEGRAGSRPYGAWERSAGAYAIEVRFDLSCGASLPPGEPARSPAEGETGRCVAATGPSEGPHASEASIRPTPGSAGVPAGERAGWGPGPSPSSGPPHAAPPKPSPAECDVPPPVCPPMQCTVLTVDASGRSLFCPRLGERVVWEGGPLATLSERLRHANELLAWRTEVHSDCGTLPCAECLAWHDRGRADGTQPP